MDHNHRSIEDNQTKSLSVLEGTLFVNELWEYITESLG